ncbi:MAG TPA: multiheme c-type cytochrome [candidate division Zixibacteria bacterium]|nr:multiheme c-type cytochrome [candidate division Zixibacteria bacterium]
MRRSLRRLLRTALPPGIVLGALVSATGGWSQESAVWGDHALGTRSYDDYATPDYCGTSCHVDFYRQWEQAMMAQAYVHHWDEIEYFKLAVPHAEKDAKVAGVKAGCNGCHAPLAFLAGDVPPPRPEAGSRANEAVSCEVCHSIRGYAGDTPYNFNWITDPGDRKYGPRPADQVAESPAHKMAPSEFIRTAEFCGTCHNEMSPYGVWVKSTHLEWAAGPYAAQGVRCQDCHMTYAPGQAAAMGNEHSNVAQHLFAGAHVPAKVKGTIELTVFPSVREAVMGDPVEFKVALFNQKTGHKFPSGSVEDRIVWLHVEAVDAAGTAYHLPVDEKGFAGEEYTIGADVRAYQDMGIALGQPDFPGVARDEVPAGDRIFRMPYFDPQGRMTIQQWNTASLGVDYRIGPRETKIETFTFTVPYEAAEGELTVTATLYYQRLVKPVADFLEVPAEEAEPIVVSEYSTHITVIP